MANMQRSSGFTFRIRCALARRAKARQVFRRWGLRAPRKIGHTKRASEPPQARRALSKRVLVLGVLAVSSPLYGWGFEPVHWIQGQHDLGSQHNILGYMWNHHESGKLVWDGAWNVFYYGHGYYCTNWDCNGGVMLVGNQSGTYLFQSLQYDGGSLNLQINGGGLAIGNAGDVTLTSYSGAHFEDTFNAQTISFAHKISVAFTTLTTHGNHGSSANNATLETSNGGIININDSSHESFTNTTFSGSGAINLNSSNITFNNVTFNNSANSTITDNGTLSLQGSITLQQNSPLNNLASTITLSNDTIFNITKSLQSGSSYNILSTSQSIRYNAYTNHLWQLIHYDGMSGSLYSNRGASASGLGTYHVVFDQNGTQYIFNETFSNKSISMQLVSYIPPPLNIWPNVYHLYKNQNWDVGDGVGYIDPGRGVDQTWNWSSTDFEDSLDHGIGGTLIIGNKTENPNANGTILFGGTGIHGGDVGYLTGHFSAGNIYMTGHIQSGNSFHDGGGTSITYTAAKQITMDQLSYQDFRAGAQHTNAYFTAQNGKIDVKDSSFSDESAGTFSFNAQNTTFNNTQFSGNSATINIQDSQSLDLTNTSFNNGMATISLNAGHGTLSDVGPNLIHAKTLNVSAQTASFAHTTFELDPTTNGSASFQVNNLTFNNDTFEGLSNYTFAGNNTHTTTFQGTTTINTNNPVSPFANLGGQIILGQKALFDIKNTLQVGNTYTLLKGNSISYGSDQYAASLWNLIHYQGVNASSEVSEGNNTYQVVFDINGYAYKMQETFGNQQITLKLLTTPPESIWGGVYYLQHKTYNVGDGIAYIDPNLKNASAPYYNPHGNYLHTWSTFGGSFSATIQGTGWLVIGNNQEVAATGGTIWIGNGGKVGYITGQFSAPNIYLTNTFKTGNFAFGGGANITFNATHNLIANGLIYANIATVFPGLQTGASQHSRAVFSAGNTLSVSNSDFSDATWGSFDFTGNQQISFSQSTIRGSNSAVILNSPSIDLDNTGIFLGRGGTLTTHSSSTGNLSANNSTFNLNEQGNATFNTGVSLDGNSALFLNNSSQANFNQVANVAGNTALNLDNKSSATFKSATTFSGNALLSLINQSQATFKGAATFSGNTSVRLSQGSRATFEGTSIFSGQSSLNLTGTSEQKTQAIFQGNTTFEQDSNVILSGASATMSANTIFNGGHANLSNSTLSLQSATFNSGDFVLQNSHISAGGLITSTGTTSMSFYGSSALALGSFDLNGLLNLNGLIQPSSTPLIQVSGQFKLNSTGMLDLSNINLFTNLKNNQPITYDILNAQSIMGLSGANGYQKIDFYGMQIKDAHYNSTNQSWSFVNPLNGNQMITESIKNHQLIVTISENPNPTASSADIYNIAPELFFYKESKQNSTGMEYDYSDSRVGTFFLDSNLKGSYTRGSEQLQIPGTYNAYNHPLDPLYIYNNPINKEALSNLLGITSSLLPALEQLLKSGVLDDLSDPNKILQALEDSPIDLSNAQKQQLLSFIGSLSSNINQTFQNGTLVVGATQVGQTNSTSKVWFGGNGYAGLCSATNSTCQTFRNTYLGQLLSSTAGALGYIQAQFNAKNIYITGTVGSGNATETGGSASVSFNSASNLVLNQANITAQGTDQVFSLLGQGGLEKILGQAGLGQALGNIIYQEASSGKLVPAGLTDPLPTPLANKTLGSIFSPQDMGAILQLPGFASVIKDILTSKTVGSLLGSGGLIGSLSPAEQNKVYGMLSQEIDQGLDKLSPIARGLARAGLGTIGGIGGAKNLINTFYKNDTLWTLMDQLSPITGMTLDRALAMGNSPQGIASLQKFLDSTTFGQVFKDVFENAGLINKGIAWLGPQLLSTILDMAIQDALNPPKALSSMAENVGMKVLGDILGPNTLKTLENNTTLKNVLDGILKDKGLGGLWQKGLGSVLSPALQQALQKAGVGSLLAPKGLSALWEKGYFSFLANENVFVNDSEFSNATGGTLSFVAGKSIYFVGNNSIDFTNYQGTLNFFSNNTSNINLTTLNATNGLNIDAQFNNLYIQKGTIALNQYESLGVSAHNFSFLGTINADGAVDFSAITGSNVIGTLNLKQNSTLSANNLSITTAFNNQSSNAINIGGDLNLYNGATLTTQSQGINIAGGFNSGGQIIFNVAQAQAKPMPVQTPLIQANHLINLDLTPNASLSFNTQAQRASTPSTTGVNTTAQPQSTPTTLALLTPLASGDGIYTLIQSNSWIHYNPSSFNPNNWSDYLNLYANLKINGHQLQLNAQGTGLTYNGQAVNISDRGLLVSYHEGNQNISASIAYNKIQVGVGQPLKIVIPTIKQYITQIQGQASVDAIESAGGPSVMGWFNKLLIETKNTPLFAPYYLEQHSLKYLVQMAKDIANSVDLIASPTLKANASDLLQISTHAKQMSRLAKLSSFTSEPAYSFHDFLESLKGKKFASAVPNAMDIITAYSQRDRLKNNLWMTGVGGASFVAGGTGTLYGLNVGYDRFIKGVIVGGYAAYGYSGFYGNISASSSNNVNVGLYSRAFVKGRQEITGSISETWGYNKTYINATNPVLSIINQKYDYNTWTTNIGANYGYDFFFKHKSVILKPQIGLNYYYIGLSALKGAMDNPSYNQFKASADPANKSVLTLNLALESRHYFRKNSYYFVIVGIGRDLFVHSMGDKMVRFIGNDTLSYRNGGLYNTFTSLTTGGEVRLWRSFYINASIGARFGLDYKDVNITGNVGIRYAF